MYMQCSVVYSTYKYDSVKLELIIIIIIIIILIIIIIIIIVKIIIIIIIIIIIVVIIIKKSFNESMINNANIEVTSLKYNYRTRIFSN